MSEEPKTSTTATFSGVLGALLGVIGGAAGSGWPGVIALVGLGVAFPVIYTMLVKYFNSRIDARDLEKAGADAGKTAVDLKNQGEQAGKTLDELQKKFPPTAVIRPPLEP
jgi:hypothetical protein